MRWQNLLAEQYQRPVLKQHRRPERGHQLAALIRQPAVRQWQYAATMPKLRLAT